MNETLASSLGLRVELVPAVPADGSILAAWWIIRDAQAGAGLGNWVPSTGSVFVYGVGPAACDDPDEVLRLFAARRKGSGSRVAAGPREVG